MSAPTKVPSDARVAVLNADVAQTPALTHGYRPRRFRGERESAEAVGGRRIGKRPSALSTRQVRGFDSRPCSPCMEAAHGRAEGAGRASTGAPLLRHVAVSAGSDSPTVRSAGSGVPRWSQT